jgi:hypothetical protein
MGDGACDPGEFFGVAATASGAESVEIDAREQCFRIFGEYRAAIENGHFLGGKIIEPLPQPLSDELAALQRLA